MSIKPQAAVKDANLKRLINCDSVDVNQLMPLKYKWAWEHYRNGLANHWVPDEVPMAADIALWKSDKLTEAERLIIKRNLGFFATAESLVANNLSLAVFGHVTNAECRQYLLRQAFEEAVHSHTFLYVVESLGLDEREIFGMFHDIPSIRAKDEFEMQLTADILDPTFSTDTDEGVQKFVENLVGFYIIMEGIFFYAGFAMMLAFYRKNMMKGLGEQISYIYRDETIHLAFGRDLINGIKAENRQIWTPEFKSHLVDLITQSVDFEKAYARDCLPAEGMLGLTAPQFEQYVEYIADRRLESIGLPKQYHSVNCFPWMAETIDISKEKNFFESRVIDYQSASMLDWDD